MARKPQTNIPYEYGRKNSQQTSKQDRRAWPNGFSPVMQGQLGISDQLIWYSTLQQRRKGKHIITENVKFYVYFTPHPSPANLLPKDVVASLTHLLLMKEPRELQMLMNTRCGQSLKLPATLVGVRRCSTWFYRLFPWWLMMSSTCQRLIDCSYISFCEVLLKYLAILN